MALGFNGENHLFHEKALTHEDVEVFIMKIEAITIGFGRMWWIKSQKRLKLFLIDRWAQLLRIEDEFHFIASNINSDGAIEIAKLLLEKGTSLTKKDNKYGNSALYTLCQEIFKIRSGEGIKFWKNALDIYMILMIITKEDIALECSSMNEVRID